jgi:hypothetical protein
MKRLFAALVVLACVTMLTSCYGVLGLLLGPTDREQADARMEQIAEAVNSHDAAALKALFSPNALLKATDIDERIDLVLSFFPDGMLSWESDSLHGIGTDGRGIELLNVPVTVFTHDEKYELFFADFTTDWADPTNVGLYGLGVTPWAEDRRGGASGEFSSWAGAMTVDETNEYGYPGIYVPPDINHVALQDVDGIITVLNRWDADRLRGDFSYYAQAEYPTELEKVDDLFTLFSERDVVRRDDPPPAPVVRENTDDGQKQSLLLSKHRVSAGGEDYWLFFADFTENTVNPDNVWFYAIGVAPWTESGDSPAEKALFSWADSFDVEASVPPGVFISK